MPIQAVIFDMDGVLVDSEHYWIQSRQEFAQAHGRTWTPEMQQQVMGRSTAAWARVMREQLELDLPAEAIMDGIVGRVIAHYERELPLMPGALEAVRLAASAYRIALASGSPTAIIERVLDLTGLDSVFEHVLYGDDFEHGKPAPDIYLETARRLGLLPAECVGIDDSGNGVRALKAAGMYAIAAPSPGFPLPADILALADAHLAALTDFSLDMVRALDSRAG